MSISKAFATVGASGAGAGGTPAASLTTSSFNSTGYTHLVVGVKHEGGATTITPSDNKSSTSWNSLTKEQVSTAGSGDLQGQFFWVKIGSPGTGHTVTASFAASRTYITVGVWLVNTTSGEMSLVAEATNEGTDGTGAGTLDAGTLSNPGGDSVVAFMMMLEYAGVTHTGVAGWTEDFDPPPSSDNFTAGYSRGAETTDPINPAGSQNSSNPWGAISCMFKEATAGGATYNAVPLLDDYYRRMRRGVFH